MNNKKNVAQHGRVSMIAIHGLVSVLCSIATTALFLSGFSAIICNVDIPLYMLVPLATISVVLAALVGAAVLAYLEGSKGLICGIAIGAIIFAIIWAASAIKGDFGLTSLAALKLIAFCAAGSIGGILGVSLKSKKQKHH